MMLIHRETQGDTTSTRGESAKRLGWSMANVRPPSRSRRPSATSYKSTFELTVRYRHAIDEKRGLALVLTLAFGW